MKFAWRTKPEPGNFGDILTLPIFRHFGIHVELDKKHFEALGIGSIIQDARPGTRVMGSGIITLRDEPCPEAVYEFVRGPMTRNRVIECGGTCPEIYGDPALLLPRLTPRQHQSIDVGLVPHFVDYDIIKHRFPNEHVVNLLNADPLQVVDQITKCKKIISSSLHGLICAHAYGIPAAWIQLTSLVKGDNAKFYDYFSSIQIKPTLSSSDNLVYTLGTIDTQPIADVLTRIANEQNDISQ